MTAPPLDHDLWVSTLDLFESNLARHEQLLTTEVEQGPGTWPPAVLPSSSIPNDLGDRARTLMRRSDDLTKQINQKLLDTPPPRSRRRAQRPPAEHARMNARL